MPATCAFSIAITMAGTIVTPGSVFAFRSARMPALFPLPRASSSRHQASSALLHRMNFVPIFRRLSMLIRAMKSPNAGIVGTWSAWNMRWASSEEAASGRVGSDAMLAKLSEALFVDTLRRYVAALPEQQTGWLAGARDPIVGKSLGLLHSRIAHPWTIADLADEVGISRTALVERFTRYLSEPPMTYLTRWRLQLAARSLENTPRGVAEIAGEVGYESEAAFSRAFKREFGEPPGRYRLKHKQTFGK